MSEALTYEERWTFKKLTPAQKRNLLALPQANDVWATVSEMRSKGATGAGMDILHVFYSPKLSQRRWTRWGGEKGQKRGEGYEYAITAFGQRIRSLVIQEPRP